MKKMKIKSKEVKDDSNLSPMLEKLNRRENYNARHRKQDREKKKKKDFKQKYPDNA